ncbi:MAG TPA: carbohydrate-binding protein, partial [Clostridia bacterium]|nr:carbohydrate-binding protein [Clostridia bacterium]
HSKGLKFGIHLMRGIPRQAVAANTPILGTNYKAGDIADKVNLCAWLNLMYGLNMSHPAAQAYLNSLFQLYASWGVDFVKVDDLINPYGSPAYRQSEIQGYRTAINNCGREIVLSTSPGATPLANATQISKDANQWRMANDLWDNWNNLNAMFDLAASWYPYAGAGHWPDADMIPIGKLTKRGPAGAERWSNLTKDEKYTMMTLWCIVRSPLMWGGNLVENRAEELQLMQNSEVIAVNQNSINSRPVIKGNNPIWCADIPGSTDKYVAVFNRNSTSANVTIDFSAIGVNGSAIIRDLWAKSNVGTYSGSYTTNLAAHQSKLYRVVTKAPDPISAFSQIEAEDFSSQSGIQTETCTEGGLNVGYIENGDYTVYSNVDFGSGASGFQARAASNADGGKIEIMLDSITGPSIGTCSVDSTGGWQAWIDVECKVSGVTGKHDLYLKFTGGSGYLFNLNRFKFLPTANVVVGDLNGDTYVDAVDYALLKMYLLGSVKDFPVENDLVAADLNADKAIDALDFAVFKQYLLGTVKELPYTAQ